MNSSEVSRLIVKYIAGDLTDPRELDAFQAWLGEDSRHQALVEELRRAEHLSEDFDLIENLDVDLGWQEVLRKSSGEDHTRFKTFARSSWSKVAITAGALLISATGAYLYFASSTKSDLQNRSVAQEGIELIHDAEPAVNEAQLVLDDGEVIKLSSRQAEIAGGVIHIDDQIKDLSHANQAAVFEHKLVVPQASYYSISLEDGTKVWLNANSELKFPSRFAGDERRVTLSKGEAYFDVASDKSKPFHVVVNGVDIRVLGTEFNVNSYHNDAKTTLVEGSLQLTTNGTEIMLVPGKRADLVNHTFKIRPAEVAKEIAWKEGEFHFASDNIAYIAEQLHQWYGVEIVFAGKVNMEKRYSGIISRESKLSEVLAILNHASGLEFRLDKGKLTVFNA